MITTRSIPILVGNIIHSISPAIRSNMRIRSLDNVVVERLDTVFQSTNSVCGLESARNERFIDFNFGKLYTKRG